MRMLGFVTAAILSGCVSSSGAEELPDDLLPRAAVQPADALEVSADVIRYRGLSRDDFRAAAPPAAVAAHAAQVGACTCALVVPGDVPTLRIEGDPHSGFISKPLRISYHAAMDRSCSWWNDENPALSAAYVLQHEQIHFAIVEQFARDLNSRIQGLIGRGASPAAANASFERQADELLRDGAERLTRRQTEFDMATSGQQQPEIQGRWFDEVEAALENSRPASGVGEVIVDPGERPGAH